MARYIGNKCKLCRREGMQLFLKGQRCFTDKCAQKRRDYPPGVHAQKRTKVSDYGVHLREKQKLKRIYGVQERQFMLYFHEAERLKGNTGEHLMALLERRIDNVILAAGLALSRNHARQLVNHGHFTVNGRWVDVASYKVRPGDEIATRTGDKVRQQVAEALDVNKSHPVPTWIEVNRDTLTVKVVGVPRREDIIHPIQEQLIIELCSK